MFIALLCGVWYSGVVTKFGLVWSHHPTSNSMLRNSKRFSDVPIFAHIISGKLYFYMVFQLNHFNSNV